MKVEIQFGGYQPVVCDLDDADDCDVFEDIEPSRAVEIIHGALMGDKDEQGWVASEVEETGEEFQVRVLSDAKFDFEKLSEAQEWAHRESLKFDTDDECHAECERLLKSVSVRERDE